MCSAKDMHSLMASLDFAFLQLIQITKITETGDMSIIPHAQ